MHTAIHSPAETVQVTVGNTKLEAIEDHPTNVGDVVTVAVFQIENLRRGCDQYTLPPNGYRRGETEVVREDVVFVSNPIGVRIPQ